MIFRGFVKYLVQCYIPNPKGFLGMQCFKETVCKFACKATWLDYFNNYYFNSGFYLRKKMTVFLRSCLSHWMVLVSNWLNFRLSRMPGFCLMVNVLPENGLYETSSFDKSLLMLNSFSVLAFSSLNVYVL